MMLEVIDIITIILLLAIGYIAYKKDTRFQLLLVIILVGLTLLF